MVFIVILEVWSYYYVSVSWVTVIEFGEGYIFKKKILFIVVLNLCFVIKLFKLLIN